jgi:hypothetical protein
MQLRSHSFWTALFFLALLAGCGSVKTQSGPVTDTDLQQQQEQRLHIGHLNGDNDTLFSFGKGSPDQDTSGGLGVNVYLWRAALDTLAFMPLASADPFGGVIITDWYQPPTSNGERFKATAYILGRQLRADGVRVQIFRQVLQGGQWVDAPVSATTSADIENKVLARARELRTQTAGS